MELSERERYILRCLLYAANGASDSTGHKGKYTKWPQYNFMITSEEIRCFLPFLELYLVVIMGNMKVVEKLTGVDPELFCKEFLFYFHDHERYDADEITQLEVRNLHDRMKSEFKEYIADKKMKPRILYISDCHFYHENICKKMDKRGFANCDEMNDYMIKQWNSKVNQNDDVYILGDFSFGRGELTEEIIERLNGNLHLIVGNHDRFLQDRYFNRERFRSIDSYKEIRDKGRMVILSHYPVFCYKGQYRRNEKGEPITYMLYGHVHNTHDELLVNRFIMVTRETLVQSNRNNCPESISCNMINCFCVFSNYQPMTLDEWIKIDKARRKGLM